MPADTTQSFRNHARLVPGFHFVTGGLVFASLTWSILHFARNPEVAAVVNLLQSVTLTLLFWYTRAFPLAVQDRLICLEERLRLARLVSADMQSRVPELIPDQLIALRFASEEELPSLVRQTLDERLRDRAAIKSRIKVWRADRQRV